MDETQRLDINDDEEETSINRDRPVGNLHMFAGIHGPTQDFAIYRGQNIIGRHASCDITLPAQSVSKKHAILEVRGDCHTICDSGSLNKTRRGKTALAPNVRYALSDGEFLLFADVACRYTILENVEAETTGVEESEDDSMLVPATQGALAIEKTPGAAIRRIARGTVLARDSGDEEEGPTRRNEGGSGSFKDSHKTLGPGSIFPLDADTIVPESDEEMDTSTSESRLPSLVPCDSDTDTSRRSSFVPSSQNISTPLVLKNQSKLDKRTLTTVDKTETEFKKPTDPEIRLRLAAEEKESAVESTSGEIVSEPSPEVGDAVHDNFKKGQECGEMSQDDTLKKPSSQKLPESSPRAEENEASSIHETSQEAPCELNPDVDTLVQDKLLDKDVKPKEDNCNSNHEANNQEDITTSEADVNAEETSGVQINTTEESSNSRSTGAVFHVDSDTDVDEEDATTTGSDLKKSKTHQVANNEKSEKKASASLTSGNEGDSHSDSDDEDEKNVVKSKSDNGEEKKIIGDPSKTTEERELAINSDTDDDNDVDIPKSVETTGDHESRSNTEEKKDGFNLDSDTDVDEDTTTALVKEAKSEAPKVVVKDVFNLDSDTDVEEETDVSSKDLTHNPQISSTESTNIQETTGVDSDTDVEDDQIPGGSNVSQEKTSTDDEPKDNTAVSEVVAKGSAALHVDSDTDVDEDDDGLPIALTKVDAPESSMLTDTTKEVADLEEDNDTDVEEGGGSSVAPRPEETQVGEVNVNVRYVQEKADEEDQKSSTSSAIEVSGISTDETKNIPAEISIEEDETQKSDCESIDLETMPTQSYVEPQDGSDLPEDEEEEATQAYIFSSTWAEPDPFKRPADPIGVLQISSVTLNTSEDDIDEYAIAETQAFSTEAELVGPSVQDTPEPVQRSVDETSNEDESGKEVSHETLSSDATQPVSQCFSARPEGTGTWVHLKRGVPASVWIKSIQQEGECSGLEEVNETTNDATQSGETSLRLELEATQLYVEEGPSVEETPAKTETSTVAPATVNEATQAIQNEATDNEATQVIQNEATDNEAAQAIQNEATDNEATQVIQNEATDNEAAQATQNEATDNEAAQATQNEATDNEAAQATQNEATDNEATQVIQNEATDNEAAQATQNEATDNEATQAIQNEATQNEATRATENEATDNDATQAIQNEATWASSLIFPGTQNGATQGLGLSEEASGGDVIQASNVFTVAQGDEHTQVINTDITATEIAVPEESTERKDKLPTRRGLSRSKKKKEPAQTVSMPSDTAQHLDTGSAASSSLKEVTDEQVGSEPQFPETEAKEVQEEKEVTRRRGRSTTQSQDTADNEVLGAATSRKRTSKKISKEEPSEMNEPRGKKQGTRKTAVKAVNEELKEDHGQSSTNNEGSEALILNISDHKGSMAEQTTQESDYQASSESTEAFQSSVSIEGSELMGSNDNSTEKTDKNKKPSGNRRRAAAKQKHEDADDSKCIDVDKEKEENTGGRDLRTVRGKYKSKATSESQQPTQDESQGRKATRKSRMKPVEPESGTTQSVTEENRKSADESIPGNDKSRRTRRSLKEENKEESDLVQEDKGKTRRRSTVKDVETQNKDKVEENQDMTANQKRTKRTANKSKEEILKPEVKEDVNIEEDQVLRKSRRTQKNIKEEQKTEDRTGTQEMSNSDAQTLRRTRKDQGENSVPKEETTKETPSRRARRQSKEEEVKLEEEPTKISRRTRKNSKEEAKSEEKVEESFMVEDKGEAAGKKNTRKTKKNVKEDEKTSDKEPKETEDNSQQERSSRTRGKTSDESQEVGVGKGAEESPKLSPHKEKPKPAVGKSRQAAKKEEPPQVMTPVASRKRGQVAKAEVETKRKKSDDVEEQEEVVEVETPRSRRGRPRKLVPEPGNSQTEKEISPSDPSPSRSTRKRQTSASSSQQEVTTPRRTSRMSTAATSPYVAQPGSAPKILFTGVVDTAGEETIRSLGGEIAESVFDCTHLVTDRVRRTVKFLCALARGIPIVTLDWIDKCKKSRCFLSANGFLVNDKEQEKNFSFVLSESLQKAKKHPLFQGYEIHVTPNVKPEPDHMKDIIRCSGATFLPKMPRSFKEKCIVVSCPEDATRCKSVPASVPITSAEFILSGILRQEVNPTAYLLNPAVKDTGPTPAKRRR